MEDPDLDENEDTVETEPVDDVTYRGRGRPRVPTELRKRAKLNLSFTGDEYAAMVHHAADVRDVRGKPVRLQEWCREVLLRAAGVIL